MVIRAVVVVAMSAVYVGIFGAATAWGGGSTLYAANSGAGTSCTSDSPCTLTEALSSATDGDTIDLAAGVYQPAIGTSFTLSNSITLQPAIPGSSVTLEGNGNTVLVLNSPVATATVSGVVIEGGASEFYGGGVAVFSGTLSVVDSTITGNAAGWTASSHGYGTTGYGGGLYLDDGTLTVEDSTISGNTATSSGGGIEAGGGGTLNVEDSTIWGNTAGDGGGIALFIDDAATVEDSTISANSSTGSYASGIYADGPVTVAGDIIAKQNVGPDCQQILDATAITDDGYNIDDDGSCGLGSSQNSDSDLSVIDNYLGGLSTNGGPTETVPLLTTPSPATNLPDPAAGVIPSTFALPVAVNGVSLACSVPDQRGDARGQPCDMGAYDLGDVVTVTFVANGGSGTMAPETASSPEALTINAFTRAGYTFAGWNTAADGSGTSYSNGATYPFADPATLYAQWVALCSPGYYSVTGSVPCTAAPPGSYVNTSGATSPTSCAVGSYNPSSAASSCPLAPPGTYVDTTGAVTATECALGTFNPDLGATGCTQAPVDTYIDTIGAIAATDCPVGTYTVTTG